jgi:hypothetical protein
MDNVAQRCSVALARTGFMETKSAGMTNRSENFQQSEEYTWNAANS